MSRRRHKRAGQKHSHESRLWPVLTTVATVGRCLIEGARALSDGLITKLWDALREWFNGGGPGA